LDPTLMTTHTLPFDEIDRGFEIMEEKLEGVIKPLITF
jgi:threonine dehydrogenase-like Zn-dependent dehydrogenase